MVVALKGKRRLYESRDGLADTASKIRAQRKFAQGVVVVSEEFETHKKEKRRKKKRIDPHALSPSPTSAHSKRPKTEDFLNFLCYRGTPALPPSLDFFNLVPISTRSKDEPNSKAATKVGTGTTKSSSLLQPASRDSPQPLKEKPASSSTTSKDSTKATGSKATPKKKADPNSNPKQKETVEKPERVKTVKVPLKVLVSPKSTRIDEFDAQFAMTALKLKYQEKRFSKIQTSSNIVSKLTKKVKDRVILTRSRANKDDDRRSPKTVMTSRNKDRVERKLNTDKPSVKRTQETEGRNAPSPDIIYGVRPRDRPEKTMSSSESSYSGEDRSSTEEKKKSPTKVMMRSLRRGRTYVLATKKTTKVKKRVPGRVSTRASRRNASSPLRELPMYGVRKKKRIAVKIKMKKKGVIKRQIGTRQKIRESESTHRPTRKTKENAAIYLGLLNKDFSSDENESDADTQTRKENDSSGNSSSPETKFLEKQYHACLKREKIKVKVAGRTKEKDNAKLNKTKSKASDVPKKKINQGGKEVKRKVPEKRILRSQSSRDAYESRQKDTSSEKAAPVTRRRVTVPITPSDSPMAGAARKTASQVPRKNYHQSSSSSSSSSSESESEEEQVEETSSQKNTKRKQSPSGNKTEAPSSSSESESDEEQVEEKKLPKNRKRKQSLSGSKTKTPLSSSESDSEEEQVEEKNSPKNKKRKQSPFESKTKGPTKSDSSFNEAESSDESEEEQKAESPSNENAPERKVRKENSNADVTSSSESEDEGGVESGSESSESESSEDEVSVQKTSIAIQVDMDSEEAEMNAAYSLPNQEPIPMDPTVPLPGYLSQAVLPHIHGHTSPPTRPLLIPYSGGPTYFPTLSSPLGNNTGLISQQQDFSLVFPSLSVPGMPGGIPMHNFAGQLSAYSSILSAQGPMCFSSAPGASSITAATTLQTHIRSVAANLDIPLVRPVVAIGTNSMLTVPFPGSRNHINIPLTRPHIPPMPLWSDPRNLSQTQTGHYSAFRIPFSSAPSTSTSSRLYTPLETTRVVGNATRHNYSTNSSSVTSFTQSQSQSSSMPRTTIGVAAPTRSSQVQSSGLSLIQSLPNVSIVPRFDRSSKPISIPPDQSEASDSSANFTAGKNKPKQIKTEKNPKKEKGIAGRKRKVSLIPEPTSPLTVRKDTSTPATYTGLSSKKQQKETKKEPSKATAASKRPSSTDPFNKLLQAKTNDTESNKSTPCSSPCLSDQIDKEKVKDEEKKEQIPEVPAYYPTDEEFQDPLKYIEQIQKNLEGVGMARIVPPRSFRPECNVEDDMRFTAYNHYINRMYGRWGPNVHLRMAILEHLRKSKVDVSLAPMIGGMEVDLATLFQTVQSFGGLKEVIEKHKWNKVSDAMHIPKSANDRATKLDAIYVKYVLPYEMLSENERKRLLAQVEEKWRCRENKISNDDYSDTESDEEDLFEEVEDCIIKGKSTPLSAYYRVARNTLSMIFRNREPTCSEVESNYWRQVHDKTRHLCVYSGSIDCAGVGWGFPLPKSMKHPWNLKVLANNPGSILRSMGPVMAQLHVGMVFTTYCWYRDPQGLPWVEYLHSGGNKIWYVVPGGHETLLRQVLSDLMPAQCRNKKIWLPSDSTMVPPELLIARGLPLYRAVQNPGEFLVVLPNSFTSAICTGYVISESISFALPKWLNSATQTFQDIRESKEPPVFALEKLIMSIIGDTRVSNDVLKKVLTLAGPMVKEEFAWRKKLCEMGVSTGKMDAGDEKVSKVSKKKEEKEVFECDSCNYVLHFSVVINKTHEFVYCPAHAIKHLSKNKSQIKSSCLLYDDTEEQILSMLDTARSRLK